MEKRKRTPLVGLLSPWLLVSAALRAGDLTPPAGPNDAESARFTLGDIWNRLATGAAGVKRGAAFTEPSAGPTTATTKTTDEIMAVAPAADNVNGATAADVAAGKTFWGLRTTGGSWGLKTGTATGGGSSSPAPVAKTGQVQCYKYDASGWGEDVGCTTNTPANQDGRLRKGVPWPNPRFTKNVNGTVRDNLTGLIWLGNANCFGPQIWVKSMNAANALATGTCGLTDGSVAGEWRLPNRFEMESLLDLAYYDFALSNTAGTGQHTNGDPFTNAGSYYWSSTSNVNYPGSAWYISILDGNVVYDGRTSGYYVWPVRGGE